MNISYNFRLAPEAVWLVVNTVIGAILLELVATDFQSIADWRAWAVALGISALRTFIGAVLAAATGGGFQRPGEPKPVPVPDPVDGTIQDEGTGA